MGRQPHVGMIAMYAQYLNEGKLIPNAPRNVIKDTGPVLQLDGPRHDCWQGDRPCHRRARSDRHVHDQSR